MLNVGAAVEPCKEQRASVVTRVEQKKGLLGGSPSWRMNEFPCIYQ